MYTRPGCYFLKIANGRPYRLGDQSDGQSLLCIWLDTYEQQWIPYTWFD